MVLNVVNHHVGMVRLKALLGDPKPSPGYELSLQVVDGPMVHWAYATAGNGGLQLVSRDPDDYAWETHQENMARQKPDAYLRLEAKENRKAGWTS